MILFTKNGHLRIDLTENLRFNVYAGGTLDLFEANLDEYDGDVHINLPYPIELPKWLADAIREAARKEIENETDSKAIQKMQSNK